MDEFTIPLEWVRLLLRDGRYRRQQIIVGPSPREGWQSCWIEPRGAV